MLPSYVNRQATSPTFKMLVGHNLRSSDPSKGESGNPVPLRRSFETQVVTTHLGNAVLAVANPDQTGIRIVVNTANFGNINLGAVAVYDEIQVLSSGMFDQHQVPALQPGNHFSRTAGGGVGVVNDVAADLAAVLNETGMGIKAEVDPNNLNEVICTSSGLTDPLFVKVLAYSYDLIGGAPPFVIQDLNGNVLYDPAVATNSGAEALVVLPKSLRAMTIS